MQYLTSVNGDKVVATEEGLGKGVGFLPLSGFEVSINIKMVI